jgi:hypothetical protein
VANVDGPIQCAGFATGDAQNLHNIAWDCMYGQGARVEHPRVDFFYLSGGACRRIACWNTSGIYVSSLILHSAAAFASISARADVTKSQVCNDNDHPMVVNWYQAGSAAQDIIDNCCPDSRGRPDMHHAMSGLLRFTGYPGVKAIVAYANCEVSEDIRPEVYEGWQANGRCW